LELKVPWPNYPSSPNPKENTFPSYDKAKVCYHPHFTLSILNLSREVTNVGEKAFSKLPKPNWPLLFLPQTYNWEEEIAAVWWEPNES